MATIEPKAPVDGPLHARGLSAAEAARRLERFGPNRLVAGDRWAALREALAIGLDPMALMLVAAAAIYLSLGATTDGVVMVLALIPVLGVDVLMQARSRQALRRLAERMEPRARVVRDGHQIEVPSECVVPGDLLALHEGDVVHADGVVRQAANLSADESTLTGEAEPQAKHPSEAAGRAESAVYAGAVVLTGQGLVEVTATGAATRYGHVAKLVAAVEASPTPLQRRTGRLVRRLAVVAGMVAIAVVALGRARGVAWPDALLGGISLAIAAVPEEFPLVFTLFLSLGAWRLGRHGLLVRRLASVETLGSTTVICTDKTGTLTRGDFAVDAAVVLAPDVDPAGFAEAARLACEARPADPMERAIIRWVDAAGGGTPTVQSGWILVRDHDFDPVGKHMSHVWEAVGDGRRRIVAKGALEGVIQHCRLDPERQAAAEAANAQLTAQGMRVLAVAGRGTPPPLGDSRADDERDLSLYGLLGFRDPLRPEVPAAVAECQAAGVHIKLVTGDHPLTAHAVADLAGIAHEPDGIVTGPELDALAPDARRARIEHASIFARIAPAQKHDIVAALQAAGEIVAMTGDGINDAPALRRADIGVSMGARATDVARGAADMVLLEDDFAALVAAVRQGRIVFGEIQRAFLYLIAFHVPIVGLALLAPLLGLPLLLLPVHLVWLELIVHPVSALVFQGDPAPPGLMRRPPRPPDAPLLPGSAIGRSVVTGMLLTVAALVVYVEAASDEAGARACALATLLAGYQLLVFVERVSIDAGGVALVPGSLRFWTVWTLATLTLPLMLGVPALAGIFHVRMLDAREWAIAAAAAGLAVGWRFTRPVMAAAAATPGTTGQRRR